MVAPFQDQMCRSSLELQAVNPLEAYHWDDLLQPYSAATVFHSSGWAQVLANTYGYKPEYFLAAEGQQLHALLPVFEVRSWATGVRGVSLPFTDQCDGIVVDEFTWPQLFHAAQEIGRARLWSYLECRGAPDNIAPPSIQFYTHQLDLTPSESELFLGCDSSMRRAIRKAEKEGVTIEISSSPEAMETYYKLHLLTRQKHGLPPQPLKFFRNIQRFLVSRGFGSVLIARHRQEPIAAAVFLRFGESSIYKFGASDPALQDLRPNNLLLWRGILHMKELGMRQLSFGRTSLNQDGLRRFKLGLGARESLLSYIRYSFRRSAFAQLQPDRSAGLHANLFRYCPRMLSRLAGATLYPHLG